MAKTPRGAFRHLPKEARTVMASPLGKFSFEIPKHKVDEETGAILTQRAALMGMNLSDYVRHVLQIHSLGRTRVAKVHADRITVIAGMGEE